MNQAGGDKIPRKGGPGISQSDLLIINKVNRLCPDYDYELIQLNRLILPNT